MIGVVSNLDEKLLYDFHGNAPIIDDTFKGQLPKITNKASIFIAEQLQPGQYFKFGVDGGGCSGFQYAFEVIDEPLETDIKFSESPLAVTDRESMPYLHGSTIDLEDSGFNNVKLWDWSKTQHSAYDDYSQSYIPHMDKENGSLMSLNIECNKL